MSSTNAAKTLLVKNAALLVTMDSERREIKHGGLFIEDNLIKQVGPSDTLPQQADVILDMAGKVVIPGLVNTHHHMYQSLTRVVPAAQDGELFNWLTNLYPIWARLTPEMIAVSTQTAMAELILSGCTTSSDHLYIYPNGCKLDDSIHAAAEIGMRFHAARGSMSVGQSQGGLPPDAVVEKEADILKESQRLIEDYHDASHGAMRRIVVAPCSPFSVSRDLMREAAVLARQYGVSLHTHLAENVNDIAYSREKFGMTPPNTPKTSAGSVTMSGTHTACSSTSTASSCSPAPAPGSPTALARTCAWPRASPRCARCATTACRWAWGSMVRRPTMAPA